MKSVTFITKRIIKFYTQKFYNLNISFNYTLLISFTKERKKQIEEGKLRIKSFKKFESYERKFKKNKRKKFRKG